MGRGDLPKRNQAPSLPYQLTDGKQVSVNTKGVSRASSGVQVLLAGTLHSETLSLPMLLCPAPYLGLENEKMNRLTLSPGG